MFPGAPFRPLLEVVQTVVRLGLYDETMMGGVWVDGEQGLQDDIITVLKAEGIVRRSVPMVLSNTNSSVTAKEQPSSVVSKLDNTKNLVSNRNGS